jgi:hypothetical protein
MGLSVNHPFRLDTVFCDIHVDFLSGPNYETQPEATIGKHHAKDCQEQGLYAIVLLSVWDVFAQPSC